MSYRRITPLALTLLQAAPALAEEAEPTAAKDAYGHAGQVGLRLGLAQPYDVHIRYDDSPPCGSGADDTKVCGFLGATTVDLALSYGLGDHLEPYLWTRFGLSGTPRTFTKPATLVGLGARVYTRVDRFKLYFDVGGAASLAGPSLPGLDALYNYDTDYPLHLHLGGQYDLKEYVGVYVQAGPNVAFVRAIDAQFEGSLGVQVRYR